MKKRKRPLKEMTFRVINKNVSVNYLCKNVIISTVGRVIRTVNFRVLLRLFRLLWNGKARGFVSEVRHVN